MWSLLAALLVALPVAAQAARVEEIIGPPLLKAPQGMALDADGGLWVAGRFSHNLIRVDPGGIKTVMLGAPLIAEPVAVALGSEGDAYVAAAFSNNVFRVDRQGAAQLVVDAMGNGSGPLADVWAVAVAPDGTVFVAAASSNQVLRVAADGSVAVVLDGSHGILGPWRLLLDRRGTLYVSGWFSNDVFAVSATGTVRRLLDGLGDGTPPGLRSPNDLLLDGDDVLVAGLQSNNVLRIEPSGAVRTEVHLPFGPYAIARDATGTLYAASSAEITRVDPDGSATTVRGAWDEPMVLGGFADVMLDPSGNVYAAAWYADRIYRIRVACSAVPLNGCDAPARARLELHDLRGHDRDAIRWSWQGAGGAGTPFGDPTTRGDWNLCLYAGPTSTLVLDGRAWGGTTCGRRDCWRRTSNGFAYRDPSARLGLTRMSLAAGRGGTLDLRARGRGAALSLPALPLALPLRAQLVGADDRCWEARFDDRAVVRNAGSRLLAQSVASATPGQSSPVFDGRQPEPTAGVVSPGSR